MIQFSVAVRNARLQAIIDTIGPSPVLRIRTGAKPATCALPNFGTVLAEMTLPAVWATVAAGVLTKSGTWADVYANNTGIGGHFRIYDAVGTCHLQGTYNLTGQTGDMTGSTVAFNAGQYVAVTTLTITEQNG